MWHHLRWTPTFNQPAAANDRRITNPDTATRHHRTRPYANHPDPTLTGELLLQAIKASA